MYITCTPNMRQRSRHLAHRSAHSFPRPFVQPSGTRLLLSVAITAMGPPTPAADACASVSYTASPAARPPAARDNCPAVPMHAGGIPHGRGGRVGIRAPRRVVAPQPSLPHPTPPRLRSGRLSATLIPFPPRRRSFCMLISELSRENL